MAHGAGLFLAICVLASMPLLHRPLAPAAIALLLFLIVATPARGRRA